MLRPPPRTSLGDGIRSFLNAHPRFVDGVMAGLVLLLSIIAVASDVTFDDQFSRSPDAGYWTLIAIIAGSLLFRRTHPTSAMAVAGSAVTTGALLDYAEPPANAVLVVLLYSTAVYARRDRAITSLIVTAAVVLVIAVLSADEYNGVVLTLSNYLVFGTAWFFGDSVRYRRAYQRELEERARRLELDQDARARAAVAEERRRITRELHDVVAHGVSVMVVQAGAARRTLGDGHPVVGDSLTAIETTGRSALRELRRVLAVLRDDDTPSELGPQPGIADLGDLVERCREAGSDIELHVGDLPGLSPGRELTIYRIVQEGLTNAMRYAGPARISVAVGVDDDQVTVEIADDGRGGAADPSPEGAGFGLVGLRERLAVFDGELTYGPRVGGGWALRSSFPARGRVSA
ncbi:MAG: histidine kinase [Actinomycetota bacterium]